MSQGVRVLILTSEMGFGHISAARALEAALRLHTGGNCEVTLVNPVADEDAPALLRQTQATYDNAVTRTPSLYELGYDISDLSLAAAALEGGLSLILTRVMEKLIRLHQPDIIVTVHMYYLAPLQALFDARPRMRVPLVTVITDLTNLHRMWFHPVADVCVTPTRAGYRQALRLGLKKEQVRLIGIPVNPAFARIDQDKASLRAELGWQPDSVTALVVGSSRMRDLPFKLHGLNHSRLPLQLVLVAGGDEQLHRAFRSTDWHPETHIYNFIDNMPLLMKAADLVIGKAGGLVVSESLAAGLPLLLVDVIPGQEEGNADYVVAEGAGEMTLDALSLLETMFHWLEDDAALLRKRADDARRIGHARAADEIADLILDLLPDR